MSNVSIMLTSYVPSLSEPGFTDIKVLEMVVNETEMSVKYSFYLFCITGCKMFAANGEGLSNFNSFGQYGDQLGVGAGVGVGVCELDACGCPLPGFLRRRLSSFFNSLFKLLLSSLPSSMRFWVRIP